MLVYPYLMYGSWRLPIWHTVTSSAVREWDEASRFLRMVLVENPNCQMLVNCFNAICILYVPWSMPVELRYAEVGPIQDCNICILYGASGPTELNITTHLLLMTKE